MNAAHAAEVASAPPTNYNNNNTKMRPQQDAAAAAAAAQPQKAVAGPSLHVKSSTPCRDFLRHVCRRGKKCKFSHDPALLQEAPLPIQQQQQIHGQQQQQEMALQVRIVAYHLFSFLLYPLVSS